MSLPAVLVLRALGVGDLLTAVPALRGVRAAYPDHRMVLAAPAPLRDLALLTGAIDEVVPTTGPGPIPWPDPLAVAVNLHGRGPQSTRALRALRPGTLLSHAHPGVPGPRWDEDLHEVRRWCRLLQYFGVPADPADLALDDPPIPNPAPGAVLVHPGCGYGARQWPADRYAAVAREFAAAGYDVLVTGSVAEYPLAAQVAGEAGLPPDVVLAARTTLIELAAVVAEASLVVCGDTGVAHLATAYGTPSVVLFGPVSPHHWGPPRERTQHVALWAGTTGDTFADRRDPGLLRITTAEVMAAAEGLADPKRNAPRGLPKVGYGYPSTMAVPSVAGNRFRRELAQQLRVDSVRASAGAGSGHPTSSMSAADLMAMLLDGYLTLDFRTPADPRNDHLVFSKGHASPLYYAMLKAGGAITDEELLTFRRFGSRLEGHPTPRIPPTDVATGSLGQGLPVAVGLALSGKRLDQVPYRVWALCGDSELAEGSVWEAFQHAAWAGLDNLVAIVDVNRLGQTRETMLGWDLDSYTARARAFGWHAIALDGHDLDAVDAAFAEAVATTGRPTVLFARTRKGRGVQAVEDQPDKHGKPLADPEAAIAELGGKRDLTVQVATPDTRPQPHRFPDGDGDSDSALPTWALGEQVATRLAYGQALTALGGLRGDVVALDGEVSNSTHTELFARAHPERYFEMFIAEQQMIAAAVGLQARGWTAFASTFGAFLSRAYDFIRMAAISRADLRLCGSHAGVSIGEDGPSQMALEDMAALRAVHGSAVLHPSDANQTARLVAEMADRRGISYLRTLRGKTRVRTPPDEDVRIGGSRVVRATGRDDITLVACGITVEEADKAADTLESEGVRARVIDCYSIKPLDTHILATAARETRGILTVEDHWPEGGLGEAVLSTLAGHMQRPPVRTLAVRDMPISGSAAELLHAAGIDAEAVVAAAHGILGSTVGGPSSTTNPELL